MARQWMFSHIISYIQKLKILMMEVVQPIVVETKLTIAWKRKMHSGGYGFRVQSPGCQDQDVVVVCWKEGDNEFWWRGSGREWWSEDGQTIFSKKEGIVPCGG